MNPFLLTYDRSVSVDDGGVIVVTRGDGTTEEVGRLRAPWTGRLEEMHPDLARGVSPVAPAAPLRTITLASAPQTLRTT